MKTGAGGRTVSIRKPVVQFVNPDDISSSDEDDADGGGVSESESNWPDRDEENQDDTWAALDPELMLKLQTLSAVLIQRAYRLYRARRLSTPWASEVSWPSSAQSGLFAEADDATPEISAGIVSAPLDDGDAEAPALEAMPSLLQNQADMRARPQHLATEAEGRQEGVMSEGGSASSCLEGEGALDVVDNQAAAPRKNGADGIKGASDARDAKAAEDAEMAAAGELAKQIETAALAGAASCGSSVGIDDGEEDVVPHGGNRKARGKLQPAAHVLRLARAGMVARGFENAAQVFVYFETGSSSGDVITGVEIERGLKALKLDGQVDGPSLLAALGAKGKGCSDAHVSYNDFMRQLSMAISGACGDGWGGLGGGAAVGKDSITMLENARKGWKKTAERVRRHVQVSKEAEQQRARLREHEEARSELYALRKQLGTKGVPFSARGHVSARGVAARKGLSKGLPGASRTVGAVTSRELAAFHPVAAGGGELARKGGLNASAMRVQASTLGSKGSVRPPKPSAAAGPSTPVELAHSAGKEGLGKLKALQASGSDSVGVDGAKRVAMLRSAAARKIQWNWRKYRGEKWQSDVASLSAFPALPGALEEDAAADWKQDSRATDGAGPDDERRLSSRHCSRQVPPEANEDAGCQESRKDQDQEQAQAERLDAAAANEAQTQKNESYAQLRNEAGSTAKPGSAPGARPRKRREEASADEAAIIIQTIYREYAKRRMEFLERQLQLHEARDEAAVRMQGVARGFLCRLRMGIRPKAKRYTGPETPAKAKRSAAAAPAAVPPTASSAVSAKDLLPNIEGGSARTQQGETAASAASLEPQDDFLNAQRCAVLDEVTAGLPAGRKDSGALSAMTRQDVGEKEECSGGTKTFTLDLSKVPEPKDLRGKVAGQKGAVPFLRDRAGGGARMAKKHAPLAPGPRPKQELRNTRGALETVAQDVNQFSASKASKYDAPLTGEVAPAAAPAGELSTVPGSDTGGGVGGHDGATSGGVCGTETLSKQNSLIKFKGEGGPGEKRRTGGVGKSGVGSKAKKSMAADMMFLCDDAVQEVSF